RWFQRPLSSTRIPRSVLFSYRFQDGLQRYQQLRAQKRLPVGCPVAPPPPGLLQPRPPAPSPPASLPRASHRSRSTTSVQDAKAAKVPHRSKGSRGQKPAGTAQPRAKKNMPRQAALGGRRQRPVVAAGSSRGDTNAGQSSTARTVPNQAGSSCEGHQVGTARGRVCPPDSEEEEELIPLRDLLAGQKPPSPAGHQQAVCPQQDPLVNSLDSLLQEKREQSQADRLQARLAQEQEDPGSASESENEDSQLPKEHRELLARSSLQSCSIPTLHPGEPIFCAHPVPMPTLDAHGLQPQSSLERLFLRLSPSCQAALLCTEGLSLSYRSVPTCPVPILRWLFQLMALCQSPGSASRALWDIWLGTEGDKPWCPTVEEITQAVTHLGANLSPLFQHCLLPPELCPANVRGLNLFCSPRHDANSTLALVAKLSDICKFLALCVATQPCCYSDSAHLALFNLFSFLGLARALRCHPLPELQHLLQCLLEGIRDWQKQGTAPALEPSCHGSAAGRAPGHSATPQLTGKAGGAEPAPGAGTTRCPVAPGIGQGPGAAPEHGVGGLLPQPQPPLP
ncbi:F178B protein, partial [Eubucco bourcierii]|nr:F178B protein [Eubucco bourcierii]